MAASAPSVARIRGLVEWVGAGRALTQTDRLRRADALELVELLDTGDVLDPRFPIQSSTELYRLTLLVEWAKVCGLVRVVRGRIVAVRKHAGLLERPLNLVERMLAGMPRLGDALGHSVVVTDGAHTVEAVFGDLVGHGGRLSLEHACDVAWSTAMARYCFPEATELQMQFQRRRSDGDVARILDAATGLGVLTVVDGEIALTALGSSSVRAWLGLGRPDSDVLCVMVTLRDSGDPSIWRRLRVLADIRLDRFHLVLCAAMGWQHDIVLEAVEGGNHDGPCCIEGAGRCPPEDVGGIPGYEDLRRVLAAPDEVGHAEALEWMGLEHARDFDPAAFDVERANDAVARALVARSV